MRRDMLWDRNGGYNLLMTNKEYLETHPWLTFGLNLGALSPDIWMLIGEVRSKCEHLAGAPLRPDVAQDLHLMYVSKGLHGTTRIEGNTLTERQVRQRIEGQLQLPESREYQGAEIDAILSICNEMGDSIDQGTLPALTPDRIKEFNRRLLQDQPPRRDVVPGEYREHSVTVGIGGYRGAPAEHNELLMERMCRFINKDLDPAAQGDDYKTAIAIIRAIVAHLYIGWIHPFGDGNGRTARLVEFQLMLEAGVPTPAAHLLSNHYHRTREGYLSALDQTSKRQGDRYPIEKFIEYAIRGLVDELREQIETVREHQRELTWQSIVHAEFRGATSDAKARQRHLALDMPIDQVVPKTDMRLVSSRVARAYGSATVKTETRDFNALVKKGLIRKVEGGYIANRRKVDTFLPSRLPA